MRLNSLHAAFRSLALALAVIGSSNAGAIVIYLATGETASDIGLTTRVDEFRAALGTLNPPASGSVGSGRREINWDGIPHALSDPNNLPSNFFNSNSPRGVVLTTPGTGFAVSAAVGNIYSAPPGFGTSIKPFSAQRMFTALGSTITDINLFIPGSSTAAVSRGFGVMFTGVDLGDVTSLEFFDDNNLQLARLIASGDISNHPFSFMGAAFEDAIIRRVRITSGTQVLTAGSPQNGLVLMDDFIFGEPIAAVPTDTVPEPATLTLAALGLVAMRLGRRRARGQA
jgi:hypothetical protein